MAGDNKTLLYIGGAAAVYFLWLKPQMTGSVLPGATTATSSGGVIPSGTVVTDTSGQPVATAPSAAAGPVTLYPYLVQGAPLPIPPTFSQAWYVAYIRPAMIAANGNVQSPQYQLTQDDANTYLANYTDLQQWVNSFKSGTVLQHLRYHWNTYGVPDKRTFLPLPWNDPAAWVPPPPNPNGGGSGIFGSILKAVTAIGAGVAIVASGGTLAPIVAPAASAAITAENAIHGIGPLLNDGEIQILLTGSAIINDILPFYNQSQTPLVKAIYAKMNPLLAYYAVPQPNPYKEFVKRFFGKN